MGSQHVMTSSYKGRLYSIRLGYSNNPCGYVRIEEGDPIANIPAEDYDAVNDFISMHGGCTFMGALPGESGVWIGFDTSHFFDNELTQTVPYVEAQCQIIIEQLIELKQGEQQ